MFELNICRICLNNNVRLHQISGSEVQDVYEKLTKVQEDGNLYFACYICYCQLKNFQLLGRKLQKSKQLLQQIPISELHLKPISFLDRLVHGLVHSLTVTNIQSLQTPEYNEFIKTEKQDESDTNEKIVRDGSDVEFGVTALKRIKLGENQNTRHGDINSKDSGKKEICKIVTNTMPYSNNLSQIVNYEKSKQALVKKTFICNDCGKKCETKAVLIKHISGHKPVTIELNEKNIENWKYLCKKIYESKIKENNISNKNLPYKCKYCNYTCSVSSHLEVHIRAHTGENPLKCRYCDYTSTRSYNLKKHIIIHTGEKPFKCQYCSYTCIESSCLKRHIRIHTGEKPFKCQYCSYTCTQNSRLKSHIRTHTREKTLKCQYCEYTCARNSHLQYHIRIHTGVEPLKCQYCNYTCTRISSLQDHIKTHTGEKLFKCQYCSYTCTRNSYLQNHIRTHTGEKPYKCQYCSYTCTGSSRLKRHIRTHTGEKPFKCQYCSYTCTENSHLKRHIRTHTKEK